MSSLMIIVGKERNIIKYIIINIYINYIYFLRYGISKGKTNDISIIEDIIG